MIVVTGASGGFGRLAVEGLLEQVPADQVVALARDPRKLAGLAARGVNVRQADYNVPDSLTDALAGADRVLLVSGNEFGRRVHQHQAVVDAAVRAGAKRIVYTSAPYADTTTLFVAPEHKATEELIRASGLRFTFLRNGWYHENYDLVVQQAVESGALTSSAHDGRVASAARADFAAAAVEVLLSDGHDGKVYELTGDVAWTFAEFAAAISEAAGREVAYRDLHAEEYANELAAAGLPQDSIGGLLAGDEAVAQGLLAHTPGELRALIGRPTTPLEDYVASVLTEARTAGAARG